MKRSFVEEQQQQHEQEEQEREHEQEEKRAVEDKEEEECRQPEEKKAKVVNEEERRKEEEVAKKAAENNTEDEKKPTEKDERANKLRLVSLEDLEEKGIKELAAVAADPVVMKFIGNSRPWEEAKIRELVDGAIGDKNIPAHKREYFSWAVVAGDNTTIGLVALRPTKDRMFPGLQFRIFVKNSTQRRGVGSEALGLMFREYKRRLDESFGDGKRREYKMFAFSRKDNEAASKCFRRCGMCYAGTKRFGREVENAWMIKL